MTEIIYFQQQIGFSTRHAEFFRAIGNLLHGGAPANTATTRSRKLAILDKKFSSFLAGGHVQMGQLGHRDLAAGFRFHKHTQHPSHHNHTRQERTSRAWSNCPAA